MRSPTQRTLELLRSQGYTVQVVETYNMFSKQRKDLFGFIDVCAIHPDRDGVLGVQTTSGSHVNNRIEKAFALPACKTWLMAKNRLVFHGWRKLKKGYTRPTWVAVQKEAALNANMELVLLDL